MLPRLLEIQSYLTEDYNTLGDPGVSRLKKKCAEVVADWNTVGAALSAVDDAREISVYVPKALQFPYVCILPERQTQQYTPKPWNERLTHDVQIIIAHSTLDWRRCQEVLLVYAEAINRLFGLDETLGNRVDGAYISDLQYSEALSSQRTGHVIQTASLSAVVKAKLQFTDELNIK